MNELLTEERIALLAELALQALTALAIFFIGWIVSKWVLNISLKAFRKLGLEEALARFFSSFLRYGVLVMTVITALARVGVETTSLAAVIAAAGLAVGLALQGSLSNFASGVLILIFRPFSIGDLISAAGHQGKVEDIGLFATTLTTPAAENIILPNASITADSIVNHTASGKIRISIDAGVAYGTDIGQVIKVLLEAANDSEHVLKDPAPAVAFIEMAASSINFAVHCWSDPDNFIDMEHNVRRSIYEHLEKAEIEIPFDQLVVHKSA